MNLYVLGVIIGLIVIVILVVAIFFIRVFWSRRRKGTTYKPSFERADARLVKEDEQLKRSSDASPRRGPELRSRFYAFGVVLAAIFGTLAVRLWILQILSRDAFVAEANENMTSNVPTAATRGRILDRNGIELITNRASNVLSGKKTLADDRRLVHRLSLLLGVPKGLIRRNLLDDSAGAQADHIIATDVPRRVVAFIKEHPTLFEGVNIESRTLRYYPYGNLGAHILGYTGPITQEALNAQSDTSDFQYESGDVIGKDGAELTFESILRGTHGSRTYKVDSAGLPTELIDEVDPLSGNDVCLTIDARLPRACDNILINALEAARQKNMKNATRGALLCIDIKDGGILASSSYPTFIPSDLSGGISADLWAQLTHEDSGDPLNNRVISGLYPAASTLKAFSSMAGLTHDIVLEDTEHECTGIWDVYDQRWAQRCWIYPGKHGTLGLEDAIKNSCNIYFYNIGDSFYRQWYALPENEKVDVLQPYFETWGFGVPTGIDLANEGRGRIPTPEWKAITFVDTPEEAQWQPGDMTNMIIGQGDLLVTPLQLANAYATFARKSAIEPHIFHSVLNKEGGAIRVHKPVASEKQPEFKDEHHARVVDGLKRVIEDKGIFGDIPVVLAGKSGTAEIATKDPSAWFVAYGPADDPQYCVACHLEEGGGGSSTAIMGVLHLFAAIYDLDLGDVVAADDTGER